MSYNGFVCVNKLRRRKRIFRSRMFYSFLIVLHRALRDINDLIADTNVITKWPVMCCQGYFDRIAQITFFLDKHKSKFLIEFP